MKIILFFVILLSIVLRTYRLNDVPPSPSLDEVSIGYNAYSILKTGRDEYGEFLPILLRAYDDWRPALYVYLVIPFVQIFGLNVVAVRLPAVILSVLTVAVFYYLIYHLFRKVENASLIAIAGSFCLAISPWHIYLSRLGHEANAGLAFFMFGLFFFLKKRFTFSIIFFSLSFMSYQAEKIFIPIIFFGLLIIFRDKLKDIWKKLLLPGVIGVFITTPFLIASFSPDALIRLKGVSVFDSERGQFEEYAKLLAKSHEEKDILGKIVHNRRVLQGEIYIANYLSHYNPAWIHANKSDESHKVPNMGLLYLWEFPLVLIGIYFLIKDLKDSKTLAIIFLWIFASPLPAAFAGGAPHAMRSYPLLPVLEILSAVGIVYGYMLMSQKKMQKIYFCLLSFLIAAGLIYLYKQYYFVFPLTQSDSFQYSISKTIPFIFTSEKKYDRVVLSNVNSMSQSYMFFLFNTLHNPNQYQKAGGTKKGGFLVEHAIDKYLFKRVTPDEKFQTNIMYVLDEPDFREILNTYENPNFKINVIKTFQNLDGKNSIIIFDIKRKAIIRI